MPFPEEIRESLALGAKSTEKVQAGEPRRHLNRV